MAHEIREQSPATAESPAKDMISFEGVQKS